VDPTLAARFDFISDLCTVLAEQRELQPILDWLVTRSTQMLGSDECSIKLVVPETASTSTRISKRRPDLPEAGTQSWPRMLKESVIGFLLKDGELTTSDIETDPRFAGSRGQSMPVRALAAVPLKVDGNVTGFLAASDRAPGRKWSKVQVQLLNIIASHSAGVIEKARLRVEEEAKRRLELEKEALDKELKIAHALQMRLVPSTPMTLGPWHVEGRLSPARQVGGDYFDYFELDGGRAVVVIADVAGKGIPAAMLVSTVQSALRSFAEAGLEPLQLIEKLNRTVQRSTAEGKFVTLFYGELDASRGRIRYVNAGHNPPRLLRKDASLELLMPGGTPLGLFELGYEMGETAFGPGDSLMLVTDGIADALDSFNRFFTEERHDALWRQLGAGPPCAMLDALMDAVKNHRAHTPQADDETALVVGRRAG
jgi:sigma-B regulation protein RsbU (phosphoserine phosphatase)